MNYRLYIGLLFPLFFFGKNAVVGASVDLGAEAMEVSPPGHDPDSLYKEAQDSQVTNLKEFFTKGRIDGHFRNFTMATVNRGSSQDYWANAIGGAVEYETADFKGFSIGLKGIFTHRLVSSDLGKRDAVTGKKSRWELQLFDIQNPDNRSDLDRLEELYLRYQHKGSYIQIGKMEINTPLINPHDARMACYAIGGIWSEFNAWKRWRFNLGWFDRSAPRSTVQWYSMSDAIGIYGNGYQPYGEPAGYRDNVETKGLGVLGIHYKSPSGFKLDAWDYLLENVMHTSLLQLQWEGSRWYGGIQYLRQDPIQKSLATDSSTVYYWPDERTNLFGARIGHIWGPFKVDINYGRVTRSGRFIFPREVGREQFFISLPRSRVEGAGDVHAATMRARFKPESIPGLQLKTGLGYFYFPGKGADFHLNKYGEPTYMQVDLDAKYAFGKSLKGLELELLYVHRKSPDELLAHPELIFNRSNFHHLNFITNITF